MLQRGRHQAEVMLLRHGIGAVGPEIDEPEFGGLCETPLALPDWTTTLCPSTRLTVR